MLCHAVRGENEHMFIMLKSFKENYPDWLYTETYLSDLMKVESLYPQAPLLKVVRGRLHHMVQDYATADEIYHELLQGNKLAGYAKLKVANWRDEIKVIKKKAGVRSP